MRKPQKGCANSVSIRSKPAEQKDGLLLFLRQFANPITLILIAAAILSFFLGQRTDSLIIIFIIFISAFLGFIQEKGAANALSHLMKIVQVNCTVLRDGKEENIPMQKTVPGDIVLLNAGNTVPGDCRLLESRDLYANEAALTGETFPAEKKCSELPANATLAEKCNTLFMGTHVVSGTAKAVVVNTGTATEFGAISQRLRHPQPETEFEKGIHRFGFLLMEADSIAGGNHFFHQYIPAQTLARFFLVFTRNSSGPHATIITGHRQHQPGQGRLADGQRKCDR